jgi:hypothetical protein
MNQVSQLLLDAPKEVKIEESKDVAENMSEQEAASGEDKFMYNDEELAVPSSQPRNVPSVTSPLFEKDIATAPIDGVDPFVYSTNVALPPYSFVDSNQDF